MNFKYIFLIIITFIFFVFLGIYIFVERPGLIESSLSSFGDGLFSIQALPDGWHFLESKNVLHKDSDIEFMSDDQHAFGIVIAENLERSLSEETIRKLILTHPQSKLVNFMLHHEEVRQDKEKKVHHIIYSGDYEGKRYKYAAWYIVDRTFLYQIITWSLENNFEKYLDSFQKIFDNFSVLKQGT